MTLIGNGGAPWNILISEVSVGAFLQDSSLSCAVWPRSQKSFEFLEAMKPVDCPPLFWLECSEKKMLLTSDGLWSQPARYLPRVSFSKE